MITINYQKRKNTELFKHFEEPTSRKHKTIYLFTQDFLT